VKTLASSRSMATSPSTEAFATRPFRPFILRHSRSRVEVTHGWRISCGHGYNPADDVPRHRDDHRYVCDYFAARDWRSASARASRARASARMRSHGYRASFSAVAAKYLRRRTRSRRSPGDEDAMIAGDSLGPYRVLEKLGEGPSTPGVLR
jgi:hypothetical protein